MKRSARLGLGKLSEWKAFPWGPVLGVLGLIALMGLSYLWRRREYRFDPEIAAASRRYQVPSALIKAVVWKESRFVPEARGSAGEFGLMQIRDAAAFEWASAERQAGFHETHLLDAGTNLFVGTWYLAKLLRRYRSTDDPLPYALADYNAGRTHVLRWMRGAAASNSLAFLAQMDFPSTRRYIDDVRNRWPRYDRSLRSIALPLSRATVATDPSSGRAE